MMRTVFRRSSWKFILRNVVSLSDFPNNECHYKYTHFWPTGHSSDRPVGQGMAKLHFSVDQPTHCEPQ